MAGVGTKKVFEDDKAIVWELELDPGEKLPQHTHELPYLWYVIDGGVIEVFGPDGEPAGMLEPKPREVFAFQIDGDELVSADGEIRVPATHSAINRGENRYREILVELKN